LVIVCSLVGGFVVVEVGHKRVCGIRVLVYSLGMGLRFVLAAQTNLCFLVVGASRWGQPVQTAHHVGRAVLVYSWARTLHRHDHVSKPNRIHAVWALLLGLAVLAVHRYEIVLHALI
jgi:hypothetical protein